MRLSELIERDVVAADGVPLGKVVDVRLVQDGPVLESFGAALRVEALIVGRAGVGIRLGYGRRDMTGPWLVKKVFERLAHRAHVVSLDDVDSMEGEAITLKVPAAGVPRLSDI